jgi:CRISPR-associated exonuclease Cas4
MYSEDDLLPISALQHLLFCERQCALIHIEQVWDENRFTAEGRVMHERVHEEGAASRGGVRIERGVAPRALRLGLTGKADTVEFHRAGEGPWRPYPVEYKRGKPKPDDSDKVQLCAQALCLEEMLGVEVPAGAVFYGQPRRRLDVAFGEKLRKTTEAAALKLHEMIAGGVTPPPCNDKRCRNCSLLDRCLPRAVRHSVDRYMGRVLADAEHPDEEKPQ